MLRWSRRSIQRTTRAAARCTISSRCNSVPVMPNNAAFPKSSVVCLPPSSLSLLSFPPSLPPSLNPATLPPLRYPAPSLLNPCYPLPASIATSFPSLLLSPLPSSSPPSRYPPPPCNMSIPSELFRALP